MTTPLEGLIAGSLAVILSGMAVGALGEYEDPFGGITGQQLRASSGVSEPVYECAKAALEGKDVDGLVAFITDEAATAGTEAETDTAAKVRKCVMMDPLGWYGTPYEQYIPLLLEYTDPENHPSTVYPPAVTPEATPEATPEPEEAK
jgi:hypothetical protein